MNAQIPAWLRHHGFLIKEGIQLNELLLILKLHSQYKDFIQYIVEAYKDEIIPAMKAIIEKENHWFRKIFARF